jgi:ribosome-associated heat shock protein Hsp15
MLNIVRLDKFIWCVRLSKTRAQATELISKGNIRLNLKKTKSSKEVHVRDIISIHKNNAVFSYEILELVGNRIAASLVTIHINDITPIEEKEKFNAFMKVKNTYRQNSEGKPSKKERRELNVFLEK